MTFLSTEEVKIGGLVAVNIASAASQPWAISTEAFLRVLLLVGQVAVAYLTAWYVYRKIKSKKTDE